MFMLQRMHALAAQNSGGFPVNAVNLDGSTDYLTRGATLTGGVSNAKGLFSCWFRQSSAVSTQVLLQDSSSSVLLRLSSGQLDVYLGATSGPSFIAFTATSPAATSTWHSLLLSWDANFSAGNKLFHAYIDDSSVAGTKTDTQAAFDVKYDATDWGVGATPGGSLKYAGDMAEVYFAMGQYLDFSNSTNRRKFVSASNKPVDLGVDGSLPTGSQPIIYLNNQAASFQTNKGSGGNLTVTGALTDASTRPSD